MNAYFNALKNGLFDESEDVQATTYQIVNRLTREKLRFIIGHLNDFKGPMTKGFKALLKKSKNKSSTGKRAQSHLKNLTYFVWQARKSIPKDQEQSCTPFCKFWIAISKTKLLVPFIAEFESSE